MWHQGGTHWYHPHHHASTSLQVGGGAHGFFILDDEPGDLPQPIADIEEVPIILSHMFADFYGQVARATGDALYSYGAYGDFFTVNGMNQPVVMMRSSFHKRFRILNAGWSYRSGLRVKVPQGCEMLLISKDGVFLPTYPRNVNELVMSNAARADVLIVCYSPGTYEVYSERTVGGYSYAGPLFTLNVESNGGDVPPVLVNEGYNQRDFFLPYYLEDLIGQHTDEEFEIALEASAGIANPNTNFTFNQAQFLHPVNYVKSMKKNSTQTWTLVGTNEHPFHIHVNHFQLDHFTDGYESNYFRPGDWHDTLGLVEGPTVRTNAVMKFKTLDFSGPVVMHCHILPHEDRGMMGSACIYSEHPWECFEDCPGDYRDGCIDICLTLDSHNIDDCLYACNVSLLV
jgi:FtsP/CotA-like multicopper oxidase with cupredoxin domain